MTTYRFINDPIFQDLLRQLHRDGNGAFMTRQGDITYRIRGRDMGTAFPKIDFEIEEDGYFRNYRLYYQKHKVANYR